MQAGSPRRKGTTVNSYLVYRASFYVLLTVSTAILSVDATDSRFDWFLPLAVGGRRGSSPSSTVDQGPRWALPRDLANVLALGTLGLLYCRVQGRREPVDPLPRPLGDYLLLIKCFLPKTAEDDWVLFLLGLTQVLIGSVINQGDTLGVWLFLWSMLAVWVLGQFFLQRESRRFEPEHRLGTVSRRRRPRSTRIAASSTCPTSAATLRVLALTLAAGRPLLPAPAPPGRCDPQRGRPARCPST